MPVTGSQRQSDLLRFLSAWSANPRRVSAIAPSTRALARLITRDIGPSSGHVIELGPGTGVFTRALLDRGVLEQQLVLIEASPTFAELLRSRYPDAQVLGMDAAALLDAGVVAPGSADAVVSGLPLLSIPTDQCRRILTAARDALSPTGSMYQFTYLRRSPISKRTLDELDLEATLVGTTVRNVPPAAVYRFSRRSAVV